MGQGSAWHPAIGLAELRIRQGRLDDAERLLLGKDGSLEALLPWARLHLARGDLDLARAATRRGLRSIGTDVLRGIELLATLVEIEVAAGDLPAASAAADQLADRARSVQHPAARARAGTSSARLLAASGDTEAAAEILQQLVDELDPQRMAWDHQTAAAELDRIRSAVAHCADRRDVATSRHGMGGRSRQRSCAAGRLQGPALPRRADRQPGSGTPRARPRGPHRRGRPERSGSACARRRWTRDRRAGARGEYRHRVEALRTEIDDALEAGMLERAESLQDELDRLVHELAAAFGLGGRDRRGASVVERARLNVTRAIRASVGKIAGSLPEAGAALDRAVRTGIYCAYQPPPGDVPWIVQSGLNGSPER